MKSHAVTVNPPRRARMAGAFDQGVMVRGRNTPKAAGRELDRTLVGRGDLDSRHELTIDE
jgi:hypothetical protein